MSKKVVMIGEIMPRLSTPDFKRFVQADSCDVTYGGCETNVSAALGNYRL
jgi:2-dehydro-3-deoxygluconokinase